MSTADVTELEIVIPKEKLNDLNFIYLKLMQVSLDTLQQISNHSDKNFLDLVVEFLPELKNLDNDEFLAKWKLSKSILNQTSSSPTLDNELNKVNTEDNKPSIAVQENENELEKKKSSTPPKKLTKKIKLSKKPKKIKLKSNSTVEVSSTDNQSSEKPKKIKLKNTVSKSIANVTPVNAESSEKPKKIKLKKKLKINKKN